MMSAAKRRALLGLLDQVEGHSIILRQKTDPTLGAPPLTMPRLEDLEGQLVMLKSDIDEALSVVRQAIWRTRTGPVEWLGPKRKAVGV